MDGVYTRAQLLAGGMSNREVSRLHRILPAIYSMAEPGYSELCAAVTLWKPTAILSHSTAAWLWGLLEEAPPIVEATVPPNIQVRGPAWVRLHRRTNIPTAQRKRFPVVPIEHCLLDVATTLGGPALEALFDAAIGTRVNWRTVAQLCDQSTGRHGIVAVREQLRTCCPATRSEPERLVARALTARNFPLEINVRVGRYYGDLVCRRGRVIVEIDGREFHTDPETFNNDRKRQNELIDADWRILRYSAATALANLDEVVDEIIRVVRKRRRGRRA
jgi:very-short-patch-repair endonuclease